MVMPLSLTDNTISSGNYENPLAIHDENESVETNPVLESAKKVAEYYTNNPPPDEIAAELYTILNTVKKMENIEKPKERLNIHFDPNQKDREVESITGTQAFKEIQKQARLAKKKEQEYKSTSQTKKYQTF